MVAGALQVVAFAALCDCQEPEINLDWTCASDSECAENQTCQVTLLGPTCSEHPKVCTAEYECKTGDICQRRRRLGCDPEVTKMTCETPKDPNAIQIFPELHLACGDAGAD